MKRLIPATPYVPIGGVNWDQPGIQLAANEATDILNLRIFPDRVETRSGCRRVSTSPPTGNPILHTERYKAPNGTELLFGFTSSEIFKFDDATNEWNIAIASTDINACESLTDWTDSSSTPNYVNVISTLEPVIKKLGTYAIKAEIVPEILKEKAYIYYTLTTSQDWTNYTHFGLWFNWGELTSIAKGTGGCSASITVQVKDSAGEIFCSKVLEYREASYNFVEIPLVADTDAIGDITKIKEIKFLIENITARSGHYAFYIDGLTVYTSFMDVTFWSTTEFTDDEVGMTLVAAGSQPPKPNDAETDGGARVLLYYDKNLGYFKHIKQRTEDLPITNEYIGIGTVSGVNTFSGILAHFPVAERTLNITDGTQAVEDLLGNGILSSIVDGDAVSTGTIDYDTGAYTVTFKNKVYLPDQVISTYDYYVATTTLPRYVANYCNRLIGFNIWDNVNYIPWRRHWTQVGNIFIWNTSNFADSVDIDISSYLAIKPLGPYLALYKYNSVSLLTYVGGTTVFNEQPVLHDGVYAGRTVVSYANKHFFLGKDNVYMFDGSTLNPLATDRVRKKIFDILNIDGINACFGYFYTYYNEYWLWITRADEEFPTAAFVYNIWLNAWTYFEFEATTCMGDYHLQKADTIDELVGTIDEQSWRLDSGVLGGSLVSPLMARASGDVFALDERIGTDYGYYDASGTWHTGSAIPVRLITKDFIYGDLHRKDRTQLIHFEACGDNVDVSWSADFGATFNDTQNVALSYAYRRNNYYPDVFHHHLRYRFEADAIDQYFSLKWVETFSVTEEKV